MKRWLLVLFALPFILLLAAYLLLPYIAKEVVENWLIEQGFENPTFTLERPDQRRLLISRIHVEKHAGNRISTLSAGPLNISYDPIKLLTRQELERIEIPLAALDIEMLTEKPPAPKTTSAPLQLNLSRFLPQEWFGYIPAKELVIGQLTLNWHGNHQPTYLFTGNIYLTRQDLLSRVLIQKNSQILARNDLTLTRDNRLHLAILEEDQPIFQLAAQLSEPKNQIQLELQHTGQLAPLYRLVDRIDSSLLADLPLLFGQNAGQTRLSLPTELDTSQLPTALTANHQFQLDLYSPKPLGIARHLNARLDGQLTLADGQLQSATLHPTSQLTAYNLHGSDWQADQFKLHLQQPLTLKKQNLFSASHFTLAVTNLHSQAIRLPALEIQTKLKSASINPPAAQLSLIAQPIQIEAASPVPTFTFVTDASLNMPRLTLTSELTSSNAPIKADISTQVNLLSNSTSINWTLDPAPLKKLQPWLKHYLPKKDARAITLQQGQYQQQGQLRWQREQLTGTLEHQLTQASLQYSDTLAIHNARITSQTHILADQINEKGEFTIDKLDQGVEITQLQGRYQLTNLTADNARAELYNFSANLLGGRVEVTPFSSALHTPRFSAQVKLHELSLKQILQLEQQPELQGSGKLSGVLPVQVSAEGGSVMQGHIASQAGGHIAYQPSEEIKAVSKSNAGLDMALQALSNFQYDTLDITADYAPNGDMLLKTRLQGANPDWNNGRPVNLSINIEENLIQLMKTLQITDKLTSGVEQHYRTP